MLIRDLLNAEEWKYCKVFDIRSSRGIYLSFVVIRCIRERFFTIVYEKRPPHNFSFMKDIKLDQLMSDIMGRAIVVDNTWKRISDCRQALNKAKKERERYWYPFTGACEEICKSDARTLRLQGDALEHICTTHV